MNNNLFKNNSLIEISERELRYGHKSFCIWLTGLSNSGKSTIAYNLEKRLFEFGYKVFVLDGDNIRNGLNNDLGFSSNDRNENIRRVGEVAKLFVEAGIIIIAAFISPYNSEREKIKEIFPANTFLEVFINTDLETCIKRDKNGLYKKAQNGEIKNFTGISSPYETPKNPDFIIDNSDKNNVQKNVMTLIKYLKENKFIK